MKFGLSFLFAMIIACVASNYASACNWDDCSSSPNKPACEAGVSFIYKYGNTWDAGKACEKAFPNDDDSADYCKDRALKIKSLCM